MADDVQLLVEAIQEADDDQALGLEVMGLSQTDNGWQPGDPLDQPVQS